MCQKGKNAEHHNACVKRSAGKRRILNHKKKGPPEEVPQKKSKGKNASQARSRIQYAGLPPVERKIGALREMRQYPKLLTRAAPTGVLSLELADAKFKQNSLGASAATFIQRGTELHLPRKLRESVAGTIRN